MAFFSCNKQMPSVGKLKMEDLISENSVTQSRSEPVLYSMEELKDKR